jgi:hypothetical protein
MSVRADVRAFYAKTAGTFLSAIPARRFYAERSGDVFPVNAGAGFYSAIRKFFLGAALNFHAARARGVGKFF